MAASGDAERLARVQLVPRCLPLLPASTSM